MKKNMVLLLLFTFPLFLSVSSIKASEKIKQVEMNREKHFHTPLFLGSPAPVSQKKIDHEQPKEILKAKIKAKTDPMILWLKQLKKGQKIRQQQKIEQDERRRKIKQEVRHQKLLRIIKETCEDFNKKSSENDSQLCDLISEKEAFAIVADVYTNKHLKPVVATLAAT